jgi:hypothetical protein
VRNCRAGLTFADQRALQEIKVSVRFIGRAASLIVRGLHSLAARCKKRAVTRASMIHTVDSLSYAALRRCISAISSSDGWYAMLDCCERSRRCE